MRIYTILFEIYGKKMKANITAYNQENAISELKNKIKIHKISSDDVQGNKKETKDVFEKLSKMFKL